LRGTSGAPEVVLELGAGQVPVAFEGGDDVVDVRVGGHAVEVGRGELTISI